MVIYKSIIWPTMIKWKSVKVFLGGGVKTMTMTMTMTRGCDDNDNDNDNAKSVMTNLSDSPSCLSAFLPGGAVVLLPLRLLSSRLWTLLVLRFQPVVKTGPYYMESLHWGGYISTDTSSSLHLSSGYTGLAKLAQIAGSFVVRRQKSPCLW